MTLRLNRARSASKAEDGSEDQPGTKDEKDVKGKGKASEGEKEKGDKDGDEEAKKAAAGAVTVDAATAERARIAAIQEHAATSAGFSALANHLSFKTGLSADVAGGILDAAMKDVSTQAADKTPAPEARKPSNREAEFRKAMNSDAPNPDVGAGGDGGERGAEDDVLMKTMRDMGMHRDSK